LRVLLTGATGYIGGRLVPRLLERGHEVRVLVRDARRIDGRPWARRVDVAEADLVSSPYEDLEHALRGVDAAYYLVHSMADGGRTFATRDRIAATRFGRAAGARALPHVIYLGGLLPRGGASDASEHLSSRAEVGERLRELVPCTELRAGPIIGSGSASFEMVRYLTERLPVIVAPRWITNAVQPIGIRDVLRYLVMALERGEPCGVVEIGADVLSFRDMMRVYAEVRGLRRFITPVPVLAPRFAGRWVGLVTPIPNALAVPLVEGIVHPVLADTAAAARCFPDVRPMPYRDAVSLALQRVQSAEVKTHWSGALLAKSGLAYELTDWEGLITETHAMRVAAPPDVVFATFTALGGKAAWPSWNWAWTVRGLLDRVVGGPGIRRGRRHPTELFRGEALDFWRVEEIEAPRLLRLRAEMKVPGKAWLQFDAIPDGDGTRLVQTALFDPRGLWGTTYWYALYPIHRLIFERMVREIARRAESAARNRTPARSVAGV
jgi:uncharacterized protein YbjT (DUF2867 family)